MNLGRLLVRALGAETPPQIRGTARRAGGAGRTINEVFVFQDGVSTPNDSELNHG